MVAYWHGRPVMTGRPQPCAMHNARAWKESSLAERFTDRLHADNGPGGFADTAYTSNSLIVPKLIPGRGRLRGGQKQQRKSQRPSLLSNPRLQALISNAYLRVATALTEVALQFVA